MKNNTLRHHASDPDLPHQRFDIITKDVIQTFPEGLLAFLMPSSDIAFLEHVQTCVVRDSELPVVGTDVSIGFSDLFDDPADFIEM